MCSIETTDQIAGPLQGCFARHPQKKTIGRSHNLRGVDLERGDNPLHGLQTRDILDGPGPQPVSQKLLSMQECCSKNRPEGRERQEFEKALVEQSLFWQEMRALGNNRVS